MSVNPFFFETSSETIWGRIAFSGYLRVLTESYKALADLTPRIAIHMSKIEWIHAHMILLARRVQDVNKKIVGTQFPKSVTPPVPDKTKVFLPIWEGLHCIGLVEDETIATRWMPTMIFPGKDYQADTQFNYDWARSWDLVIAAREQRVGRKTKLYASREHIAAVDPAPQHPDDTDFPEKAESEEEKEEKEEGKLVPDVWEDRLIDDFIETNYRRYPTQMPTYDEAGPDSRLTEARDHGQDLHWDPQLWHDYQSLQIEVGHKAMWSLGVPHTPDGHYGWICQVSDDVSGFVGWSPHNKVAPISSMFAVIFRFGYFEADTVSWFRVKSAAHRDPLYLMLKWIHAFCPDKRTY